MSDSKEIAFDTPEDALKLKWRERLGVDSDESVMRLRGAVDLVSERRIALGKIKTDLVACEREPLEGGKRSPEWRRRFAYLRHRASAARRELDIAKAQALDLRGEAKAFTVERGLKLIGDLSKDDAFWVGRSLDQVRADLLAVTRAAFLDVGHPSLYAKAVGHGL